MQLYYVQAESIIDVNTNLDLFVHAETPQAAFDYWKAYYPEWDDADSAKVWAVPTPAGPGAVAWDKVTVTEFKV